MRVSDRLLLYAAGTLRAIAAATTGVSIGAYLKTVGYGAATVGYATSAGLAGAAIAMLLATLGADRVGRRRALVVLSALGGVGGTIVLWPLPARLLISIAFFAMWNGMGRDRGPVSMLEQAMLPARMNGSCASSWRSILSRVSPRSRYTPHSLRRSKRQRLFAELRSRARAGASSCGLQPSSRSTASAAASSQRRSCRTSSSSNSGRRLNRWLSSSSRHVC